MARQARVSEGIDLEIGVLERKIRPFIRASAIGIAAYAALWAPAHAADRLGSDRLRVQSEQTGDNSYVVRLETRLPTGWEAGVGMDMTLASPNKTAFRAGDIDAWQPREEPTTVAWSSLSMPAPAWLLGGETTFRARLDPIASTATMSGSVTRSHPLGESLSASLTSDLVVTETGIGTATPDQTWEANRSLRLDFEPTKTALIARGQVVGPDPDVNTFVVAEQSLGGGLGLSSSLSEIETGNPVFTIGARLNRRW